MRALKRQARGNGITSSSHNTLLVRKTVLSKYCVNGFQIIALWERHEVVTACIANQIFDAAFLPPGMHICKERENRDRHCGSAETSHALVGYVPPTPAGPPV